MPTYEIPAPPPFLPKPGRPAKPWPKWRDFFTDVFLVAAAGEGPGLSPKLAKALLIYNLGEGQRILDTMPALPKVRMLDDFFFTRKKMSSWSGSHSDRGPSCNLSQQLNMCQFSES